MSDPLVILNEAAAALKARDRAGVAARLNTLVRSMAVLGERWDAAARMGLLVGEVNLTREASLLWAGRQPQDVTRQVIHAGRMAEMGQVKEGLDHVRPLLAKHGGDPMLNHFVGTAKSQLGDMEGAVTALRRALRAWPGAGASWLALANVKTWSAADPDRDALLKAIETSGDMPPLARAQLHYANAKMLADMGETDAAFAAVDAGARLIAPTRPYDAAADAAFVDQLLTEFPVGKPAPLTPSGASGSRAIFVMGMPRSGTTLVEQLLAAHSSVADGGEINLFRTALQPLDTPSLANALAREAREAHAWSDAAAVYDHLLEERFGPRGRIVDKTLSHTRYVGLLRHVFPDAKIIWMRRAPDDVAWSCLRTCFSAGLGWSFDQAAIGRHMAAEDRLHAHFSARDADAVLTVPYESLVADPEAWSDRILAHVGLTPEPIARGFHKVKRAVTTSSVAQVRRPVSQKAVDSAQPYEAHLAPFRAAYEEARKNASGSLA